jgi:hypothetical protein
MLGPFGARRRHAIAIAAAIAATLFVSETVASEIFKCVAKDGSPLYQNFPCDIDSMGFLPSAPAAKPAAAVAQDKSSVASVKPAASVKSTEPNIGMSSDEVRTLLGEPQEMIEDEPASGGRVSTWRYSDGRSIQFDHKHRVLSVQR